MKHPEIPIAIADDHQLFREGLGMIIEMNEDYSLVAEAENGQQLIDAINALEEKPQVVLLDLKMPVKDGMETLKEIKASHPEIQVLILTMIDQDDYILHLLDLGANGYLLKNSSSDEVQLAIKTVLEKGFYFNEHVSRVMLEGLRKKRKVPQGFDHSSDISGREREVLNLLCKEHTTAEIAELLFVSVRTVETHRKHLMEKLGAKNTAGIIYRAVKEGLVE
jgi:DNA-binding NarL/FixJ family response regulator